MWSPPASKNAIHVQADQVQFYKTAETSHKKLSLMSPCHWNTNIEVAGVFNHFASTLVKAEESMRINAWSQPNLPFLSPNIYNILMIVFNDHHCFTMCNIASLNTIFGRILYFEFCMHFFGLTDEHSPPPWKLFM